MEKVFINKFSAVVFLTAGLIGIGSSVSGAFFHFANSEKTDAVHSLQIEVLTTEIVKGTQQLTVLSDKVGDLNNRVSELHAQLVQTQTVVQMLQKQLESGNIKLASNK